MKTAELNVRPGNAGTRSSVPRPPPPVGRLNVASGGRVLMPHGGVGPEDTIRVTTTLDADGGGGRITLPDGTVVLAAFVTVPTRKPALVIAVDAAACVCPTTFGT